MIDKMNDKTKLKRIEFTLKRIELAIENYNSMIRTLKKQMRATDSLATRQLIAQYQRGRDVLDITLGLERIT